MSKTKEEIIAQTLGLSVMDKEAKDAFEHLQSTLTVKDMLVFQPIVEATNEVAEILDIKYDKNEDSIQAYKDGKRTYGAFNTKLRDAKKELKEPFVETTKAIDAIFKKFGEVYNLAKSHLEVEFKPYTDEQQRLKEEKEKKKNAAREKEMEDLKKQNESILENQKLNNIYHEIYYNGINTFKINAVSNLNSLNTDALQKAIDKTNNLDLKTLVYEEDLCKANPSDLDLLEKEKRDEIYDHFVKTKASVEEVYKNRLTELVELQNMRSRGETPKPLEVPDAPFEKVIPEEEGSLNMNSFDSDNFIENTVTEIMDVRDRCDYYTANFNKPDKELATNISTMLTRALDYINSKKQ